MIYSPACAVVRGFTMCISRVSASCHPDALKRIPSVLAEERRRCRLRKLLVFLSLLSSGEAGYVRSLIARLQADIASRNGWSSCIIRRTTSKVNFIEVNSQYIYARGRVVVLRR